MAGDFLDTKLVRAVPGRLAPMAERAATALKMAKQTVAVCEGTTAGLIQAALYAVPEASQFTTCGFATVSPKKTVAVLAPDLVIPPKRPSTGDRVAYKTWLNEWSCKLARHMKNQVGATWCIAQRGCPGDNSGEATGVTSIFVSGPVEKGITVESPDDREKNMWSFGQHALTLLAECVEKAATEAAGSAVQEADGTANRLVETAWLDHHICVHADIPETDAPGDIIKFARELPLAVETWENRKVRGIWLTVPLNCVGSAGPAAVQGFDFHHAQPGRVTLTRWLAEEPCKFPPYGFTVLGVTAFVFNNRFDKVLLVQEKTHDRTALTSRSGSRPEAMQSVASTSPIRRRERRRKRLELQGSSSACWAFITVWVLRPSVKGTCLSLAR